MSIPNGPTALAVKEAAWGLARYAAISQVKTTYRCSNKPLPFLFNGFLRSKVWTFSGQRFGTNCGARDFIRW